MPPRVTLISYTPDPERLVATAARLCYSEMDVATAASAMAADEASRRSAKMVELGHHSTLEHVSFTFGIAGVSRALTHQLVRHRLASYSQQSQRYINFKDFEYVTPATIRQNEPMQKRYHQLMAEVRSFYDEMITEGIPREDARYIFPNAVTSQLVMTMNARSLLHFFRLRLCLRAQHEIRAMAGGMLGAVRPVAPSLFKLAGPGCVSEGICRENYPQCPRKKK